MTPRQIIRATAAAVVAMLLAACGPVQEERDTHGATQADAAPRPLADPVANLAASEAYLQESAGREGVVVTDTGLQYEVLASGDPAGAHPEPGQFVCVHYRGELIDGTEFDSSYARGEPAAFASNRLIPAWVEALSMMRPGDVWKLYVHPDLAYRDHGQDDIGPNEALVFRVELLALLNSRSRLAAQEECLAVTATDAPEE